MMDGIHLSPKGAVGLVLSLFLSAELVRAELLYVDPKGLAGYSTITAAVEAARTGDTIVLRPGTYGGAGNTNIRIEAKSLTIRSTDPNDPVIVADTRIDCSTSNVEYSHAFTIDGTTSPAAATIAGLTLTRSTRTYEGGAVLCMGANVTLVNCAISSNHAAGPGGGLCVLDGQATLTGCSFRNNVSDAASGGAIFCRDSTLDALRCTFESNSGGAVRTLDSRVTLTRCSFTDNTGDTGGAVYGYVARNLLPQTHLIVSSCTFLRNSATTSGGALYIENVPGSVTGCTFLASSTAGDGGAISNTWASSIISGCSFIGNTAGGNGGAVFNWNQSSPQVVNCTFVSNQAASGGAAAIKLGGEALFQQCILWDNGPQNEAAKNFYVARNGNGAGITSKMIVQYCDVQGGRSAASATVDTGCTLTWGTGNKDADPLFIGPLQNDYHLSPDSPCIDAGDPAFVVAGDETDLDGSPRVFGDVVDMGVFEFQGLGPVYRFWSLSGGAHFYTISGSERDKLINESADVWQYEGVAFYAYFRNTQANLAPVYRFWSTVTGHHLYTISESEKTKLTTQLAKDWKYEGIVFYTYAPGKQPFGTIPVHRFAAVSFGDHFYTANENEKDKLLNQAHRWVYEGIAWYAFARPNQHTPATYEFSGGDKAAVYTLTLAAYIDGAKANIDQPLLEFVPERTQALMAIDFGKLQTTLNELHVQTKPLQSTLKVTRPGLSLSVPLTVRAGFEGLSARGPFGLDPATGLFADFRTRPATDSANAETFTCEGSATFGGSAVVFNHAAGAVQFELSGSGSFESLPLLPDGLDARLPLTFQWRRPYVKDLLAQGSVNGHLVQLYVTNTYVGTQDLWQGRVVK